MSHAPYLLLLHGVGSGDPQDSWTGWVSESLAALGYPALDRERVVSPQYAYLLRGTDDKFAAPPLRIRTLRREEAGLGRRAFEQRMGAIEYRLGKHEAGTEIPGAHLGVQQAMGLPTFAQARNYVANPYVRAAVLKKVLEALPAEGDLVVVAHSLGSVVAADLLRRLPLALPVRALITVGSPLATPDFDVDGLRETLEDPPSNLGWWVNFWNNRDPVAAWRGVSSAFPWMLDFKLPTSDSPARAHSLERYVTLETVARAVGFAVFGSLSTELAQVERGAAVPLDDAEVFAVTALRYAHIASLHLQGEVQQRFRGALRSVQAEAVRSMLDARRASRRPIPDLVAALAFNYADASAMAPPPRPLTHLDRQSAAILLTVLATGNVIRPFDITVPPQVWLAAMETLSAEMGLTTIFGADVIGAAKEAQSVAVGSPKINVFKWGAIGVGAVALVVLTGGVALAVGAAAGAGLVGAAAITSALAAFGPGGMIGGLLTAGTLISVGGGGLAAGLASPGVAAETVEEVIRRLLTVVIVRRKHDLEQDGVAWAMLTEMERAAHREFERLDEFSDPSSPVLRDLSRKLAAIRRALAYLLEHDLAPKRPE